MASPLVIGRRLRRVLGALLVSGFGLAWWSFVPTTVAADPVVEPMSGVAPHVDRPVVTLQHEVAHPRPVETPVVVTTPVEATSVAKPVRVSRRVIAKPRPVVAVVQKPTLQPTLPSIETPRIVVPEVVLPKPPPADDEDLPIRILGRSS